MQAGKARKHFNELTLWCREYLENLTYQVKKYSAFYGDQSFITVFTTHPLLF
jgi:hypothetical protein